MDYKLELFGKGKKAISTLEKRTTKLMEELQNTFRLCDYPAAGWKEVMLHDLKYHRSWNILSDIGGIRSNSKNQDLMLTQARKYLTSDQLQEAFTLAVNSALLPTEVHTPGHLHGHTIIYEELINTKSPFYGLLDDKLRKRLNNGRFWENLPELTFNLNFGAAYKPVEDVLINNIYDLDVNFARKGLDIFYKANPYGLKIILSSVLHGGFIPEDLTGLPLTAVDRYVNFIRVIDSQLKDLKIPEERFAPLVNAYIDLLNQTDTIGCPFFDDVKLRKQDLLVKKYSRK
ncbi:hypothetical protein KY304_01245 [Candidatus Woesearchaeota archaeon]|nr:hypothetical protein [Candidatus Woesearchaeota archaeon]